MDSRILFTRLARGLFLPHISFVQIFTRSIGLQFIDRNCCVLKELLGIFWSKVFRAEIIALHLWIECIYSLKNCSVILDEKYLELQELQWISVKEILKCIFLIEIISCWKNFSAFSWLKLLSAKRIRVHFIDRRYWVLRSTVLHFLDWNYCLLTELLCVFLDWNYWVLKELQCIFLIEIIECLHNRSAFSWYKLLSS